MTRTKAEAIASPQAGDRWEKAGGTLSVSRAGAHWVEFHWCGSDIAQPEINESAGEDGISAFRRWATGAEYLGGLDEPR